jgi:hypothetical protein
VNQRHPQSCGAPNAPATVPGSWLGSFFAGVVRKKLDTSNCAPCGLLVMASPVPTPPETSISPRQVSSWCSSGSSHKHRCILSLAMLQRNFSGVESDREQTREFYRTMILGIQGGSKMPKARSELIIACYRSAREARRMADVADSPSERQDFISVEQRWLSLARSPELWGGSRAPETKRETSSRRH